MVALGGEQDDIVAAFQAIEWMGVSHLLDAHRSLALVEPCHETPTLVLLSQLLATSLEVGIQFGDAFPEVV